MIKKNIFFRIIFLQFILIMGCTHSIERNPNAVKLGAESELESTYNWHAELNLKRSELRELKRKIKISELTPGEHEWNSDEIRSMELSAFRLENEIQRLEKSPPSLEIGLFNQYKESTEKFSSKLMSNNTKMSKKDIDWSLSEQNLQTKNEVLFVSDNSYKAFQLKLNNNYNAEMVFSTWRCLGESNFSSFMDNKSLKGGEIKNFKWYNSNENGQRVKIEFEPESLPCTLEVALGQNSEKPFKRLSLYKDTSQKSRMEELQNKFEICQLPKVDEKDQLKHFYFSKFIGSVSCPSSDFTIETLMDSKEGFNKKVEMLLGRNLSDSELDAQDPFLALDFSGAPALDGILISYLVFRNDFSGKIIQRLLEHHASKGTPIKILVADVITLEKDRVALSELTSKYPSITVEYFKFEMNAPHGFKEFISKYHRSNHVKLFLTYSSKNPDLNRFIIGGRNIHDGFLFDSPADLSRYPELVQYGQGKDESFAKWTDFEVFMQGEVVTKKIASHFFTYWDHDSATYLMRPFTVYDQNPSEFAVGDESYVRHVISVPYADDHLQEELYQNLFDKAISEIKISSPYLHLTDKLMESLKKAVNRGVKLSIITRLDLEGDTIDYILSEVNKNDVNRFFKRGEVLEFVAPKNILHSKIVLIDKKLSIVGSVNLNQRSFFHDTENSLMIWSGDFYNTMNNVLESYSKDNKSRKITEKLKTNFWKQIVIKAFAKEL